jgi:hypothetical protein
MAQRRALRRYFVHRSGNFERRQARPLPGLTVVGARRHQRRKRAAQRIAAGAWWRGYQGRAA